MSGRPLGYTGHLNLDALGLVHMGGRLYDPELGRMISADPNVQYPLFSQGFNRYSYVNNNPLSYTDPSGYFSLGQLVRVVAIAVISYYTTGWAAEAWSGAAGGTAAGTAAGSTSAVAGPHDVVMRSIMNQFGNGTAAAITNVPLMLPAAIFTWAGFVGTDPATIACNAAKDCR